MLEYHTKEADGLNFHWVSSSVNKGRNKCSASLKAPRDRMKYCHNCKSMGFFSSDLMRFHQDFTSNCLTVIMPNLFLS